MGNPKMGPGDRAMSAAAPIRTREFWQPQGRPAPIPAGGREIPERPLLAKKTALANLADLNLQPAPGNRRHQGHMPTDPFGCGANKQRTCHGADRQRTAQPGAARTRGALAPRVSPWPAAQAKVGRRRFGGVSERLSPMGCPFPSPGRRGPMGAPLGRLDHRDGGVGPALQLAG